MRIDQWLWCVRVYKTRSLAATAIKAGRVLIDQQPVKPSREARPDDVVAAQFGAMTRTFRVLGAPSSRVGAKLVAQYAEELTDDEQFAIGREQARVEREWRVFRRTGERPTPGWLPELKTTE